MLFSTDPWLLHVSPNFQLDFRLSSDVTRIRLDLRPIKSVDPTAKVLYLRPDGIDDSDTLKTSALLVDEDALFFEGDALLFDHRSRNWRKAGWGRVAIRRPQPYLFEGFFILNGDYYHVSRSDSYLQKRHPGNPSPPRSGSTHMVVWHHAVVVEDDP